MSAWFEREEERLVESFNSGEIDRAEFNEAMRDLRAELRQQAEDAADAARDEVLGGWR